MESPTRQNHQVFGGVHLIFISNVASGASNVVVARVDGSAGTVIAGTQTTVANNYYGQTIINGPEFVQKPTGELGMIYAGSDGVHGVFRSSTPTAWNAFNFDVFGAPTNGSPSALPATSAGAYPIGKNILGLNTYGQALGSCSGSACFGALATGTYTNVATAMSAAGLTASGVAMSPRDGYLFISACDPTNQCGIYEAEIDGNGGFVTGTLALLADVNAAPSDMAAATHPVTGTTVLFSNNGSSAVNVWQQPAAGGPLSLLGTVPVSSSGHYRAEASGTQVVLNYLIRSGAQQGSYAIPVNANGNTLAPLASAKLSSVYAGSEFDWMPAAGKWAFFFRPGPGQLTRCWVTP